MTMFTIEMVVTETKLCELCICAESEEEARRLVAEYEFDTCDIEDVQSMDWIVSDVEVKEAE